MRISEMKTTVFFVVLSCRAMFVYAGGLPDLTESGYLTGHNDKGVVLIHTAGQCQCQKCR